MNCNEIQTLLLDFVYGVLEPAEEQAIENHLTQCPGCQKALVWTKNKKSLVKEAIVEPWPQVRFDAGFLDRNQPSSIKATKKLSLGFWIALAALLFLQIGPLWLYVSSLPITQQANNDQKEIGAIQRELAEIQSQRQQLEKSYEVARLKVVEEFQKSPKIMVNLGQGNGVNVALATDDPNKDSAIQVGLESGKQKKDQANLSKDQPNGWFPLPFEKSQDSLRLQNGKTNQSVTVPIHDLVTFLHLDKTSYRPGETIRFRSMTLNRIDFTRTSSPLALRYFLVGPDGEKEIGRGNGELRPESGTLLKDAADQPVKGFGSGSFSIPLDAKGGAWKIEVREALNRFYPVSQPIQLVSKAPLNTFQEVRFDKSAYLPGDRGQATIRVWDLDNQPLANQKLIMTLSFGGVPHQIDGTPLKRGKIERVTDGNGLAVIEFQIPTSVSPGKNELAVQANANAAFSSIVSPLPLFSTRPQITFTILDSADGKSGAFPLVWATDEQGNPSPLKGFWKANSGDKTLSLVPFNQNFPMGLYHCPKSENQNQEWELVIQGPGDPQTISLPTTSKAISIQFDGSKKVLNLISPMDGTGSLKIFKKGRLVFEKPINLTGDKPQTENLGQILKEKEIPFEGLFQVRLDQKTSKGQISAKKWVVGLEPVGPNLEWNKSTGSNHLFLKGLDGKVQTGIALAMVYQAGSAWVENGMRSTLMPWLAEFQSENIALPEALVRWLEMLPTRDRAGFLETWLAAFPKKWETPIHTKPLAIQNPFRNPKIAELNDLSLDLDQKFEKTEQNLAQLLSLWQKEAPARELAMEKAHYLQSWFWGMGIIQLIGFGFVFVVQKGLAKTGFFALLVVFVFCSLLGWMGIAAANRPLEPTLELGNRFPMEKPGKTGSASQEPKSSVPENVDPNRKGSDLEGNLEVLFSKGSFLQTFWIQGNEPQTPPITKDFISDNPDEWPMPKFLAKSKGFNQPDASSLPMPLDLFFRGNLMESLANYPLISWNPCLILGKDGWKCPEFALEKTRLRIFLLVVSDSGGITCMDQPVP